MKNAILSLIAILYLGSNVSFAQPDKDYEDLLLYYVDEKYDKCVDKAYRYTQNDKTKRDPLPYLFASMSFFEISKNPEKWDDDEFKRAYKDAMSFAGKYYKKDKDLEYISEYEDFFTEFKLVILEETQNYMALNDIKGYKKALANMKKMVKFAPNDIGIWFIKSVCDYENKVKVDGLNSAKKAKELLAGLTSFENLKEEEQFSLRLGLMQYAMYQKRIDEPTAAKEAIDMGFEYFQDDEEYKKLYDELH
jgi:hypothetical protein